MKLSHLGEFGLIDRLARLVGKPKSDVLVGIGDDAAVLKTAGPYQLITTDALIENIHFKLKNAPFFELGYKALAINISDIAAMGGIPTHALVTIGANKDVEAERIETLYKGILKAAKQFKVDIIGGDTVQSPKEMVISITLLGEVERDCLLTRSRAKFGDAILATGVFGGEALRKYRLRPLSPLPRIHEARAIAWTKHCTSMIDSSDGLVRSVIELCRASKAGARIWLDSVPIAKGATLDQALYGGEEYELVFTVPRSRAAWIEKSIQKKTGTKVSIIGEVVDLEHGLKLVNLHGKAYPPKSGGYEHFR